MGGVEQIGRVVRGLGLTQHPADHLSYLGARSHALVDVGEVDRGVVPAFLQPQVEDDVLVLASGEVGVVLVGTAEQDEVVGERVVLVDLPVGVHRDRGGIDTALLSEVAPDQNGWSLAVQEGLLRALSLVRGVRDDVRVADVDGLGLEVHPVGASLSFGLPERLDERGDRLLHRRVVSLEENGGLHEPGVDDLAGGDLRDQLIRGPVGAPERLNLPDEPGRDLHGGRGREEDVRLQVEQQVSLLVRQVLTLVVDHNQWTPVARCVEALGQRRPHRLFHGVDVALVDPEVAVRLVLLVEGAHRGEVHQGAVRVRDVVGGVVSQRGDGHVVEEAVVLAAGGEIGEGLLDDHLALGQPQDHGRDREFAGHVRDRGGEDDGLAGAGEGREGLEVGDDVLVGATPSGHRVVEVLRDALGDLSSCALLELEERDHSSSSSAYESVRTSSPSRRGSDRGSGRSARQWSGRD